MEALTHFAAKFEFGADWPAPVSVPKLDRLGAAQTFAELGFASGAEIGVASGVHSELLLKTIPELTLHCVDPWVQTDGYESFHHRRLYQWRRQAYSILRPLGAIIHRQTSMDAVKDIPDHSLDFVYIDGAHDFRHAAEDIYEWSKKVRPGGVLYGHDYILKPYGRYACHVPQIVKAYVEAFSVKNWLIFGEGGSIKGKPIPKEWMMFL